MSTYFKKGKVYINNVLNFLLLNYPTLVLSIAYIFKGDNVTTFECAFFTLAIILCCKSYKFKVDFPFILQCSIVLPLLVISFFREESLADFLTFISLVISLIFFELFSNKFNFTENFSNYLLQNEKIYYSSQILFYIILFKSFVENGFQSGWGTEVLAGPFSLSHKLAYLLTYLDLICVFLFVKKKSKLAIVFAIINVCLVLMTAVRTALFAILVIGLYFLFKKKAKSIMYVFLLVAIGLVILLQTNVLEAVILKTDNSRLGGSISNGRPEIFLSSLQYLTNQSSIGRYIFGGGISKLYSWNYNHYGLEIHAHNDFLNIAVCYGLPMLIVFVRQLKTFIYGRNAIWTLLFILSFAFFNGFFNYHEAIICIIYIKAFFEYAFNNEN